MSVLCKKITLLIPIIILAVFFYFSSKKNSLDTAEYDTSVKTNVVFELWKKNYIHTKTADTIDKIQMVREGKVYRVSDLSPSQKELFKLMLLYKTKKDVRRFSDSLSSKDVELVSKIIRETDEKIAECKTNLYNLKGEDTHKFDKFFLENLDVYFFN